MRVAWGGGWLGLTMFCKRGCGNARSCFDSRFVNLHMDDLSAFNHFHDWYMDTIQVSKERETLTLGLYLQDQRASVSFVGLNRCVLENLGLQNIVYAIEIVEPGTSRFGKAQQMLAKAE